MPRNIIYLPPPATEQLDQVFLNVPEEREMPMSVLNGTPRDIPLFPFFFFSFCLFSIFVSFLFFSLSWIHVPPPPPFESDY